MSSLVNLEQRALYNKLKEQPVGSILKAARDDMDLEVYHVAREMARSDDYIRRIESGEYIVPPREIAKYLEAVDRISRRFILQLKATDAERIQKELLESADQALADYKRGVVSQDAALIKAPDHSFIEFKRDIYKVAALRSSENERGIK